MGWLALGLLFGPFALLAALVLCGKVCSSCRSLNHQQARCCSRCGRDFIARGWDFQLIEISPDDRAVQVFYRPSGHDGAIPKERAVAGDWRDRVYHLIEQGWEVMQDTDGPAARRILLRRRHRPL